MATDAAPARLKAVAMAFPIPDPPPVTRTFLPAADSSGRVGEIESYALLCQVLVKDKIFGMTMSSADAMVLDSLIGGFSRKYLIEVKIVGL